MASDLRTATPLGPLAALSTELALAASLLVGGLLWAVLPEQPLPLGLATQHQDAETLTFLVTFALLVPLSVIVAGRLADRSAVRAGGAVLSAVVAVLAILLEAVVLLSRASLVGSADGGFEVAVAGAAAWGLVAAALLGAATMPPGRRAGGAARALGRHPRGLWLLAAGLLVPAAMCFADPRGVHPAAFLGAAVLALAGSVLASRWRREPLRGWLGGAVDGAVVLALVLAVPALSVFGVDGAVDGFDRAIIQFHQDFFLGPANQILAGDVLLVDVLSQYGVGSIYFLAAAFHVVPIGNGTLALVEGALSVLMYVGTYAVLRIAGVHRLVAAATMAVAVVALVFALGIPLGGLLQHGAIRYGLPVGAVLGTTLEGRGGRGRRAGRALTLATMGVAAVWALESFAYTALTAAVGASLLVRAAPPGRRRAEGRRWAVQLIAAVVAGHAVLAAGTWVAAGELPRWSWYAETLRAFLFGDIGELTYDFSSYSTGLLAGALYVGSACGLAVVVTRRQEVLEAHRALVVATGAVTAHGIGLFSYLVNRSADHIVPYVSLPALALVALWLHLLGQAELRVPETARRVALALAIGGGVVLVGSTWSTSGYERSALAHAVPGGRDLRTALRDLRHLQDLKPGASEGARLLAEHLPEEDRSIVITDADLSIEVLMRAERGSRIPLGDPWEDSFVPEGHLDQLAEAVRELAPGDRALLDPPAMELFEAYQADPELDPFAPDTELRLVPTGVAPLQRWVLRELAQRFDLAAVSTGPTGLTIVELVPRG